MKVVVARVRDFPPGDRRIVEVGRRSIGVFRVGDRFYAINNHCPHQGGPLCLGRTAPWVLSAGPGEFRLSEEDALLACPWHGWEYDLATGQSFLGPGAAPVRGYEVSVESGAALSGDAATDAEAGATSSRPVGGRVPGPYVAETFAVRVGDAVGDAVGDDAEQDVGEQYVVVDTGSSSRQGGDRQ